MSQYLKQIIEQGVATTGHPTTIEVSNHPTSIEVSNHPASVAVSNHPTTIEVSNHPASVAVSNHPTTIEVSNHPATIAVSNHPTTIEVSNHPSSFSVSNQITGFATETSLTTLSGKVSTGSGDVASGTEIQRFLAYGLNGQGVKHPLDVDSSGHLKITQQDREIQRATTTITTDFTGGALSGSFADGKETAYWDSSNYDKFQAVISSTNGGFGALRVQGSQTTTDGDFVDIDEAYELSAGANFLFRWDTTSAFYKYYRFKNSTGAAITFSSINVHFLK